MAEHPRRRLLATLRARFDGAALSVSLPGHPAPPLARPTAAQWAGLQAWCFEGAGNGRSPLLRPTQAPQVDPRLSVAVWPADDPAALALIEAFSRHLDGSHQLLEAGGALSGLLLRLRVKACDVAWWRSRMISDPWDCGYALNEPEARAALARFEPRRSTLVVAVDWPADALVETLNEMQGSSSRFLHPVRWLVVQRDPGPITERLRAAALPATVLQPRAAEA
ncbi:hypothetical protein BSY239_3994 [Hydrogenophaga sp. RAC07]|uniref:hypothetical protein n=1 Tax=Hydrogenophaga sp. RAC07 TaxID=1842537 RepID=UPI00083CAC64|nr:hypothetical protein [Hydrogenophaga sp. RAC07]AOF87893.1 hypothetical protein BSY239_3994 [Hydrogenophaga sp. RAC07]